MLTGTAIISAAQGLHARPAGELVKLAKSFTGSRVTIDNGMKVVNAVSMLSLLSLGLKKGTEVSVSVEGGDEAAAVAAIVEFLNSFD